MLAEKQKIKSVKNQLTIHNAVFTAIDIETTGLNPFKNRITEIGMVKICGGVITDEYQRLINPGEFIPPGITALTGITNEMVFNKPEFEQFAAEITQFIGKDSLNSAIAGHNVMFDIRFLNASMLRAGYNKIPLPAVCTSRLARRLNRQLPSKSLKSLKKYFGIYARRSHRALDDAKAAAQILTFFIEQLVNEYELETLDELISFQFKKIYDNDSISEKFKKLKSKLKSVPEKPGVYYMLNRRNDIIYIGKAKNLKDRLNSYFYHNISHTSKINKLLKSVYNIDWETTGSELSALITESKMIKSYKPKFNSAIKSYRKFPFIKIDIQRDYPKVQKVYEILPDKAKYFGPFASNFTVDILIERINKLFKLRKCDDIILKPNKNRSACMYYEINQCLAPCNFTATLKQYKEEVKNAERFLTSSSGYCALNTLTKEMNFASEQLDFEKASHLRDNIEDLKKVILNSELNDSIVETQNYIIKCKNYCSINSYEIFLIACGKIAKTYLLNTESKNDEFFIENLKQDLNYLYFSGELFREYKFSNCSSKFTINEIDTMKIITNYVYRNYKPSLIYKINLKSDLTDILKFIFKD